MRASLAALAVVVAAGCGGSSSAGRAGPSPSSVASAPASSATGPGSAGTAQQIRQAWITFFKGSTPAAAKIALLQHGSQVAAVINAQAGNTLAIGTEAKVSSVTIRSPSRAVVNYEITLDGQPALTHQHGAAVNVGGHWLVSLASFCGLLSLEGTHPAACPSAASSSSP